MTTTLPDLLQTVKHADIRLGIEGGFLRVDAPAGVLTPELRAALVFHKLAILESVRSSEPDPLDVAREAIVWESTLESEEAERVLTVALSGWNTLVNSAARAGIPFEPFLKDGWWYFAPPDPLLERYDALERQPLKGVPDHWKLGDPPENR